MKKYLLSEADRKAIADMMSRERSAPPRPLIADTRQKPKWEEGDSYWVLPPCETGLPAAEIVGGKLVTIGVECCLYRHVWALDELEPVLDTHGNAIRITVFNYYTQAENGLVQVYKHKDGTWTNERPERQSSVTTTISPVINLPIGLTRDLNCAGECIWNADVDGVWQAPTGGCANTTTGTSTTLAPARPGTTSRPQTQPTTPAPCDERVCVLVCTDTSTTPEPIGGVPVPYNRFRYTLAAGSSCPDGCTCYGLGDACYLVEGEVASFCSGVLTPSTPTTTTLSPSASACVAATAILGAPQSFYYRAATKNNAALTDWQVCQTCPPGSVPLYPLRGAPYRIHDRADTATVYESPCVSSPCNSIPADTQNEVVYVAYPYDVQVNLWGYFTGATFYDTTSNPRRFIANWFLCKDCETGERPDDVPPLWIYEDISKNEANGVFYDQPTNTYRYYTKCQTGFPCSSCGRAPLRKEFPYQGPLLGTSTTSTTTGAPCGCIRPNFCPVPFECVKTPCVRGGEVRNGTFGTTLGPVPPCFADSTTTPGPTTTSTTTPDPGQCVDSYGTLCNCATTTTTVSPSGGTCPPGYTYFKPECRPGFCATTPTPPGGGPGPGCTGICVWRSYDLPDGTLVWRLAVNSCWDFNTPGCEGDVIGATGSCACNCPEPPPPTACGIEGLSGCYTLATTTTAPTTLPPCACCSTTTLNPCDSRKCRYRANAVRQWVLVANNCPSNCPCPDPGGLSRPASTCESFSLPCGYVLPPPTTRPPTTTTVGPGTTSSTTTTTTADPIGCCQYTIQNPTGTYTVCTAVTASYCIASGGAFFGPSRVCTYVSAFNTECRLPTTTTGAPTTTTGTTTTGTTTTQNPCSGPCPLFECGCTGGGTVDCGPLATMNCQTCLCEPIPLGRCCEPDGFCSIRGEQSCLAIPGATWVEGQTCAGNPCPTTNPPVTSGPPV